MKSLIIFSFLVVTKILNAQSPHLHLEDYGGDSPPPGHYYNYNPDRHGSYVPMRTVDYAEIAERQRKKWEHEKAARERYLNSPRTAEEHKQAVLKTINESQTLPQSKSTHDLIKKEIPKLIANYNKSIVDIIQKVGQSSVKPDPRTADHPFYTPKTTLEGDQLHNLNNYKNRVQDMVYSDTSDHKDLKQSMVDFADLNLQMADQNFVKGFASEGWHNLFTARKTLDSMVDFTSGAAFVRDVGIVMTGYNIVAGEEVGDFERSVTLGMLFLPAAASGTIKTTAKIAKFLNKVAKKGGRHADKADEMVKSIRRSDHRHKDSYQGEPCNPIGFNLKRDILPFLIAFSSIAYADDCLPDGVITDQIISDAKSSGSTSLRGMKAYADRTKPTRPKGSSPKGDYEPEIGSSETKRSIRRQNESADTLAGEGFDLEMLPKQRDANGVEIPGVKNPDFKIDGKEFDAYSPKTGNPSQIRKKMSEKVSTGQADRIVLNLDDSPVEVDRVRDYLSVNPINGLEELVTIKNGEIRQLFPF